MRILIADDDFTSREVIKAMLEKACHEVLAVRDGTEALATIVQPGAPSLLILDWMMPGPDGEEVCRRIRSLDRTRSPYIIMLTCLDDKEHLAVALDAGANDYLVKPPDPNELRARITVAERTLALQDRLATQAEELRKALAHVKTLRGMLPICCYCKRIRDDKNYWRRVEEYVTAYTDAVFSHGVCPECMQKHFPEDG